jgi:hypothetical protein
VIEQIGIARGIAQGYTQAGLLDHLLKGEEVNWLAAGPPLHDLVARLVEAGWVVSFQYGLVVTVCLADDQISGWQRPAGSRMPLNTVRAPQPDR